MRKIAGKRAGLLVAVAGFTAWIALGSSALASNHLIKIREVYPGDTTHPDAEYVELQMYAPGQTFFNEGTTTTLYDATGTATTSFSTLNAANPPNGASQDRVLIASPSAVSAFNLGTVGYQFAAGDHLSPAGGAACYESSTAGFNDCVSWGNFSGTSLPSQTGGNVDPSGIPNGDALGRSIAAGCPTLLEASDDTNSPADWSDVAPNPLKNSDTPPEHPCANTTITKKPRAKTTDRTPTFKFTSSVKPATFACKIDSAAYAACTSPFTSKKLSRGKHTFKVRATADGFTDPTPAKTSFKIVKP